MSESFVNSFIDQSVDAISALKEQQDNISAIVETLVNVAKNGGTIYTCGNGGSACDAMHFSEELVARYKRERPGIRAAHFNDAGNLSCWANDYDWEGVFARQAETMMTDKDVLIGFTTSGNSKNVLQAFDAANKKNAATIALVGKDGGKAKDLAKQCIIVKSNDTEKIQQAHITLVHIFCELLENTLFGE